MSTFWTLTVWKGVMSYQSTPFCFQERSDRQTKLVKYKWMKVNTNVFLHQLTKLNMLSDLRSLFLCKYHLSIPCWAVIQIVPLLVWPMKPTWMVKLWMEQKRTLSTAPWTIMAGVVRKCLGKHKSLNLYRREMQPVFTLIRSRACQRLIDKFSYIGSGSYDLVCVRYGEVALYFLFWHLPITLSCRRTCLFSH